MEHTKKRPLFHDGGVETHILFGRWSSLVNLRGNQSERLSLPGRHCPGIPGMDDLSAQRRTERQTQIYPPRVQFSGLQRLLRPQPFVPQRHEPSTDRQWGHENSRVWN